MKIVKSLPEGYKRICNINLQKDKKVALLVNIISLVIGFGMAVAMHFFVPISTFFDFTGAEDIMETVMLKIFIVLIAMTVYIVLHELTHAAVMKYYGAEKIKFGFTGLYAFAGTDDYIAKKPYNIIALAPVVLWGIVLLALLFIVPADWFWVVYLLEIVNVSGAAGDIYVSLKFRKMPEDILIYDSGVSMNVYSKEDYEYIDKNAEKEYEI